MNADAVTNVACPRLTMPPSPVITTNERNTTPSTMPLAMSPDQNSFANHELVHNQRAD